MVTTPPALAARASARNLLTALLVWTLPVTALAHGTAVPIENYGPFLPGSVTCLRMMSQATHECFDTVLGLQQRCQDTRARGGSCDSDKLDEQIQAASDAMLATVMKACAPGQLTEVGYIGFFDAEADLVNACSRQARDAIAAAYAPLAAGPATEADAACMAASAAYARKAMRFILDRETPVMERFATHVYPPDDKQAGVRAVETELSTTRQRWIAGLLQACPQFETLYGRSADSFMRTVKQRTDCVLSKTYVTSAVICLKQVCGNGIVEEDEQCDDGNSNDTDACRNDCTSNTPTPGLLR